MDRLIVATLLWDADDRSREFSRCYDEIWVEKLCRGFRRNLTRPFRFVCFTDRVRKFSMPIDQEPLLRRPIEYGSYIEPFRLDAPMILLGLDTVIVGNIDHLADHCGSAAHVALPRDPYAPARSCNGVALVPEGQRAIYEDWRGENDMEWLRTRPHEFIDDLFPGHVVSFKGTVRDRGLSDARIVYFHGNPKMHQMGDVPWVRDHWA